MIALKMKLSTIDKSLVPNVLHFLWIGDLNEVKAHYIEIWQKTNKDKDVFFWCDSDSSLCKLLNTAIIDFVNTKRVKDKLEL
ncbi:TcdA/TcdB catalytic glycosyltransferase domain-containing protein, partial [Serratia surfactantfaciens]